MATVPPPPLPPPRIAPVHAYAGPAVAAETTTDAQHRQQRPESPSRLRAAIDAGTYVAAQQQRTYGDLSTIDWLYHITHRRRRSVPPPSSLPNNNATVRATRKDRIADALVSAQDWIVAGAIGLAVGFMAAWLGVVLEWMSDLKEGVCAPYPYLSRHKCCWEAWDESGTCDDWWAWSYLLFGLRVLPPVNLAFYMAFAGLFAAAAATLTVTLAPTTAPTSGIPIVKTILGGFVTRSALSVRTAGVKFVALVLAVASGMAVGHKAPLVHIGACIGHVVARRAGRFRTDPAATTYMLSAAGAAGMACAFGSPIGGVLYALEEISSFFPLNVMSLAFFCCLTATLTLSGLDPLRSGTMTAFQDAANSREWHLFELLPFAFIAVVGGLLGSTFNKWNVRIQLARDRSQFCKAHPIREVVALSLGAAFFSYMTSFSREPMISVLGGLIRECDSSNYHGLCNPETLLLTCVFLLYTMAVKFVSSVTTYGASIPAGAFLPSMLIGACFGRVVGIIMEALVKQYPEAAMFGACQVADRACVTPGTYALLGAAAALTGVTRLTISIAVILFELTGALNFILPTILVVVVAKFVADLAGGPMNGLANLYIQLRNLPWMDAKEDLNLDFAAADMMRPAAELVVMQRGMALKDVRAVLDSTAFATFPIVDDLYTRGLEACVTRADLEHAIATAPIARATVAADLPVHFYGPAPLPLLPPAFPSSSSTRPPFPLSTNKASSNAYPMSTWSTPTATQPTPSAHAIASYIDVSAYVDPCPLTVHPATNASMVYALFAKLGLRYVFVKRRGALVGIITKKDLIRAANLAGNAGGLVEGGRGVDALRAAVPDLDPMIHRQGREWRRRLRRLREGGSGGRRKHRTAGGAGGAAGGEVLVDEGDEEEDGVEEDDEDLEQAESGHHHHRRAGAAAVAAANTASPTSRPSLSWWRGAVTLPPLSQLSGSVAAAGDPVQVEQDHDDVDGDRATGRAQ
ncbi:chloride channel [Blastocladiella britannica]|nr:chloride channel [Blastocladiella britannica]